METANRRSDRIKKVFERVDKKLLENEANSSTVRDHVAAQVREIYQASGEDVDEATLHQAVEEVLAEEKQKQQPPAPGWIKAIPLWAWVPIIVGFLVIAIPMARIVVRLLAVVFRI